MCKQLLAQLMVLRARVVAVKVCYKSQHSTACKYPFEVHPVKLSTRSESDVFLPKPIPGMDHTLKACKKMERVVCHSTKSGPHT